MTEAMKTKALAPWFGANRLLASRVGPQLLGTKWVGIPFCGGMSELPYIECRGGICNDLHRHIINLARVIRNPVQKNALIQMLDDAIYHPDELAGAQLRCLQRESDSAPGLFSAARTAGEPDLGWAYDYFVSVWMGRGGNAGSKGEFRGGLPTRWNANGGGSNVRFRSAVASVDAWHVVLKKWEFETLDAFDFMDGIADEEGLSLFVDAPWPDAGAEYKHKFADADQIRLAEKLSTYKKARIVIRFGDHPLIRQLYPEPRFTWVLNTSRDQDNKKVSEVLILNGPSFAGGAI